MAWRAKQQASQPQQSTSEPVAPAAPSPSKTGRPNPPPKPGPPPTLTETAKSTAAPSSAPAGSAPSKPGVVSGFGPGQKPGLSVSAASGVQPTATQSAAPPPSQPPAKAGIGSPPVKTGDAPSGAAPPQPPVKAGLGQPPGGKAGFPPSKVGGGGGGFAAKGGAADAEKKRIAEATAVAEAAAAAEAVAAAEAAAAAAAEAARIEAEAEQARVAAALEEARRREEAEEEARLRVERAAAAVAARAATIARVIDRGSKAERTRLEREFIAREEASRAPYVPAAFRCCGACELDWSDPPAGRCVLCAAASGLGLHGWLCRGCFHLHKRGMFPGHDATAPGARSARDDLLQELGLAAPPGTCATHGAAAGATSAAVCFVCIDCGAEPLCVLCVLAHPGHAVRALVDVAPACRAHLRALSDGSLGAWPAAPLPVLDLRAAPEAAAAAASASNAAALPPPPLPMPPPPSPSLPLTANVAAAGSYLDAASPPLPPSPRGGAAAAESWAWDGYVPAPPQPPLPSALAGDIAAATAAVQTALVTLATDAAAAEERIRAEHAAIVAAANARRDELLRSLEETRATKAAALGGELAAARAFGAYASREADIGVRAASLLPDADAVVLVRPIAARLREMYDALSTGLPPRPASDAVIGVACDPAGVIAALHVWGRVLASAPDIAASLADAAQASSQCNAAGAGPILSAPIAVSGTESRLSQTDATPTPTS